MHSLGFDGQYQGTSREAGVRDGVGSHGRRSAAPTLPQAHERHREVTQGHPGAGGHGEVLRQGEPAQLLPPLLIVEFLIS